MIKGCPVCKLPQTLPLGMPVFFKSVIRVQLLTTFYNDRHANSGDSEEEEEEREKEREQEEILGLFWFL